MLLSIICDIKRLTISLSKTTFEKNGKGLIGLNEVGVSSGLSGLEKRTILENVHNIGKYDSLRQALKIYVIGMMAFLGRHLATATVIRSKPGDFFSEYFWMVCLTSFGVKYFSG